MTKQTEALKLALEALEAADWYINQLELIVYCIDDEGTHENRAKVQASITAIKEALAHPWPDLTEQQRESYQKGHNDGVAHHKQAVKAAQPEQEQEQEPEPQPASEEDMTVYRAIAANYHKDLSTPPKEKNT